MAYKLLWIFVEGNDDKKFVNQVIKPIFENKYDSIKTWEYRQKTSKLVKGLLKSIKTMGSDYFFLADINNLPCVTARKEKIKDKYGGTICIRNLIVVIKEIESWYLAGLDDKKCQELGLGTFSHTDDITKEQFNRLMPEKFDSRIDFMAEILKRFSIETAKQKKRSFNYFMAKI